MKYPEFFDKIENIILKDKLSEFLGSTENGIIEISYLDIVKFAGHSCGTVGGAYIMAQRGLKELYGDKLPIRGEIKVELRGTLSDNTGVTAMVFSNITGATNDMGFLGIQGKFNRRGLLIFGADINSDVRFTRLDTKKSVEISYSPMKVVNPREVMQSATGPNATEENKNTFAKRWQQVVETIFINK